MKNMKNNQTCKRWDIDLLQKAQYDKISIYIQDTLHKKKILKLKDCRLWLHSIFQKNSSITIRIVGEKESESLNYNYRNQKNFMMKGYQSNQSPFSVLTIPSSCQPIERFCQYSQPYHLR